MLSMSKESREYLRHKRIWTVLRFLLKPFFIFIFKFKFEKAPNLKEPYLVLSNHNSDLDPALMAFSFPKQMYFVASEHVYRRGLISKLLYWAFKPIAKMKGSSDAVTVMQTIRMLRSGKNVCLFPEGNRSFNGRTGPIMEATGKLVKVSNVSLVTYKFEGGYFTSPRWGFGIRRGKLFGHVENVYTKEALKEMSAEEITNLIIKDLEENAYKRQLEDPIKYKGKKLAEGMESAVCICPKCSKIDSILTKKDKVWCSECGISSHYSQYGLFDDNFPFKTIEAWDDFQTDYINKLIDKSNPDEILFQNKDVLMNTVSQDHKTIEIGKGCISMCSNKLLFITDNNETSIDLKIEDITDMSIYGKCSLVWSDIKGVHYEIRPENIINMRKYLAVFNIIKNQ